jgi:hypothetical protein
MTKIAYYVEIDNTILYATAIFIEGEEETNYPSQVVFQHAYIDDVCVTEMLSPTQIAEIEQQLFNIYYYEQKEPTPSKDYNLIHIISLAKEIEKLTDVNYLCQDDEISLNVKIKTNQLLSLIKNL